MKREETLAEFAAARQKPRANRCAACRAFDARPSARAEVLAARGAGSASLATCAAWLSEVTGVRVTHGMLRDHFAAGHEVQFERSDN